MTTLELWCILWHWQARTVLEMTVKQKRLYTESLTLPTVSLSECAGATVLRQDDQLPYGMYNVQRLST